MHLARWALVLLVATPGAAAPPPREFIRLKGRLDIAIALSERSLLWSPQRRTEPPTLYRLNREPSRMIWRSPAVPVPPGQRAGSAVMFSAALAASPSTAAVVRATTLSRPGGFNCHDCEEPMFSELFVGPANGKLRLVEGRAKPLSNEPRQHWVQSAAVTGSSILFAENIGTWWYARRSRVVLLSGRRRAVLADARQMSFRDVKAAGRYAAWGRRTDGRGRAGITVFDLRARRVSYRIDDARLKPVGSPSYAFALAPDGKIAILVRRRKVQLLWASPRSPRPHVVPVDAGSSDLVPIAMNRKQIVFLRISAPDVWTLVATDLRGRSIRLDTFRFPREAAWQLALAGRRVAWVAETREATSVLETRLR